MKTDRELFTEVAPAGAKFKSNWINLASMRFGKLVAIAYLTKGRWRCRCDCGGSRVVHRSSLLAENPTLRTTHCGCMRGRTATQRLLDRLDKTDECWVFTGSKAKAGYGVIREPGKDGKLKLAHRLAYEHFVGPIPPGLLVLHHCDNPPCCRPDHLFVGDKRANALDALAKGRLRNQVGPIAASGKRADA